MTFRVGQKVVCIRESAWPSWCANTPVKGDIYTVRAVFSFSRGPCVYLYEIANDAICTNDDTGQRAEPGFPARDFRRVVERKTDISVFTEILRKATKPARVPSVAITQQEPL